MSLYVICSATDHVCRHGIFKILKENLQISVALIPPLLSGVSVLVNISKMSVHWNWSRFGDFMCSRVSILVSS